MIGLQQSYPVNDCNNDYDVGKDPTSGTYRKVAYNILALPNHCKKAINADPLTSPVRIIKTSQEVLLPCAFLAFKACSRQKLVSC